MKTNALHHEVTKIYFMPMSNSFAANYNSLQATNVITALYIEESSCSGNARLLMSLSLLW